MVNSTAAHPIILFDGVCNLCNSWVQFVIKRDPHALFQFASLQSDVANELLQKHVYKGRELGSVILIDNEHIYSESTAVLHITARLKGAIKLLTLFRILPAFVRNPFYRFVARNRYKWFGKQTSCMIPTKEIQHRFIV